MRDLPKLGHCSGALTDLLTCPASGEAKSARIEDLCALIVSELKMQGLSECDDVYLEPHAFSIQSGIRDREIRELHIMEG